MTTTNPLSKHRNGVACSLALAPLALLILASPAKAALTYTGADFPDPPYTNLYLGYNGTGSMTLDNTGTTTTLTSSTTVYMGYNATDAGTATITGSGAVWTISGTLFDGVSGSGTINVSNGGSVVDNGSNFFGNASSAVSNINVSSGGSFAATQNIQSFAASFTVDGSNSSLTATNLNLGEGGNSSLSITNGGTVTTPNLQMNNSSNATATVLVDNSTLKADTFSMSGVGSTAQVIDGGQLLSKTAIIISATSSASTGSLLISGAGSTVTTPGLTASTTGNGSVTVANGGALNASTGVALGNASAVGTLQIGNGGASGVVNAPVVIGSSSAKGVVVFDHTDSNYYFTTTSTSSGGSIAIENNLSVQAESGTTILNSNGNTYNGGTQVTGGKLLIDNSSGSGTGTGNVAVSAGGVLGGTGIIKPTGANGVTVSGAIAPGNTGSVGKLTIDGGSTTAAQLLSFAPGATLQFTLGTGLSSSNLTILNSAAGGLQFNNTTIDLFDLTGGNLASGTYSLITANNANVFSGLITDGSGDITGGLSLGNTLPGETASLSLSGATIDLTLSAAAVPEPSTWALIGFGLLLLTQRRKTRRNAGASD